MSTVTVGEKGNSLYVNIPAQVRRELSLHKGDTLEVNVKENRIVLEKEPEFNEVEFLAAIEEVYGANDGEGVILSHDDIIALHNG